jgi:hypothetical protein
MQLLAALGNRIPPVSLDPGANPTIASYNASVVKIYNIMSSLVRFEAKIISSTLKNAQVYYNAMNSLVRLENKNMYL